MASNPAEGFSLFVSCIPGKPVTRFGTGTFIGAHRSAEKVNELVYEPELIVAIPDGEHARHRKAYNRLVAEGDLKVRKPEEWVAQGQRHEKETEAQQKKATAEAAGAKAKAEKRPPAEE